MIGDWFSLVAVSIVSLRAESGGVLALATSFAAHMVPQAFAAPLGGLLADRLDKRKLLIAGSLVEGVLTVGMTIAAAASDVLALQLLVAARSVASAAREPAIGSSLPRLVQPSELVDANAFSALTWSVAFALGMSLGGFATTLGPAIALGFDAATFLLAASLMRWLPALPPSRVESAAPKSATRESFEVLLRACDRNLRGSVFGLAPAAFAAGAAWLWLNLAGHALAVAGGAAATVGILQGVRGVGTALGPLATRWLGRISADLAIPAAIAVMLGTFALAWSPNMTVASVGATLWGAGGGALWVIMTTEIQQRAEDAVRGRLIALSGLGFTFTMTAGVLLAALAIDSGYTAMVVTTPIVVVSLASFVWLRRPIVYAPSQTLA